MLKEETCGFLLPVLSVLFNISPVSHYHSQDLKRWTKGQLLPLGSACNGRVKVHNTCWQRQTKAAKYTKHTSTHTHIQEIRLLAFMETKYSMLSQVKNHFHKKNQFTYHIHQAMSSHPNIGGFFSCNLHEGDLICLVKHTCTSTNKKLMMLLRNCLLNTEECIILTLSYSYDMSQ